MAKRKILLGAVISLGMAVLLSSLFNDQTAVVSWTDRHQQIDGFGASSANIPALRAITDAQADMFFDPEKGIGLSLLRTQIQSDGSSTEIITAQKAVKRGVKVWASPWSPPAKYKTNGSLNNGGYLIRSDYGAWAEVLARYARTMQSEGVPIYAISVQNEPDISQDYPSCLYTAQDIRDFVPYLHSALESARVSSTKIMIAEDAEWTIDLSTIALADPIIAPNVGIVAAHGYGRKRIRPYTTGSARLWETEVWGDTGANHFDPGIAEGLIWASSIHRFLTVANVNAWHWWTLMTDGDDNGGLTDLNGYPAKRMYVLGQWSKFVRPGWYRIGVQYHGPLQITAFKDPAGKSFVIVAVNLSGGSVLETFSLAGFAADFVAPWITSASLSLSPEPNVLVRDRRFTYALPPSSVVTFSGTALAGK